MNTEQILYEDKDLIVCYKPAGMAVQTAKVGQRDMVSEITGYLAQSAKNSAHGASVKGRAGVFSSDNGKSPYVGIIHRLDQPVEGILVFAKNPKAAGMLSRQMAENKTEKYYYAVISSYGLPKQPENVIKGTLVDYLYKDGKTNTSTVVSGKQKDAKRAELSYEVCDRAAEENIALAKIKLVTGRHHQIRVQMSHAGMSLLGDYKYADEETKKLSEYLGQRQVALCAYEISFRHPETGKQMRFHQKPKGQIFQKFL